ncbi:MAG TPA: excinuclease ABC subunit UvrC [Kofleriaceae bacterium]|nr:excinuclease ABC subunit UvrC [Kofleriaceae bacterium]
MSLNIDDGFFERIPTLPGVYLMKDRSGAVIYVGKAINLRTRVRQYFRPGGDSRFFVAAGLLGRVLHDIDTVVVDNEKEALLLENHLIKQHQPRFNINLRDDKQYLVLRIDTRTPYPRVEVVRNIRDDGARYFGPYHSATSARETLRTLNRHFQLRTCTDHVLHTRGRPCLQYQIKRCPAPCVFPVDPQAYAESVEDVGMFLGGKSDELVKRLRARMDAKAEAEEYEAAALTRDSLVAVERAVSAQNVVQDQFVDQDVFGLWREGDLVELVVLFVRAGKLVGRRAIRQEDQPFPDGDVMADFVQQYYATGTFVPDEVLVPFEIEGHQTIADWLSAGRGRKVRVMVPARSTRRRLIDLANKNAAASASSRKNRDRDAEAALAKLQQRLSLKALPRRIECFDIAHIQGAQTVASRVVFVDGVPERAHYRKFKVKSATNDDFAAMYEVLTRRFRRGLEPGDPAWAPPDLLIVDGGKGQLGSALAALGDLGIEISASKGFDVIGLAKERDDASGTSHPDRVYLRNAKDPVKLRANTSELYLLSRVRDEAHRFANTFHRQQRSKSTLRSALDDIPGIGAKRRRVLLRTFGSVKAIRAASVEALAAVEGMTRRAAEAVRGYFDA